MEKLVTTDNKFIFQSRFEIEARNPQEAVEILKRSFNQMLSESWARKIKHIGSSEVSFSENAPTFR